MTATYLAMLAAVLLLDGVAVVADALNGPDPGNGDMIFVVR